MGQWLVVPPSDVLFSESLMKPTEASELERGKHFLPVPTEGGAEHRVQHTSALSQEGSCPLFAISPKPHGDAHCPLRWPTAWQALGSGWKVKRAGQGLDKPSQSQERQRWEGPRRECSPPSSLPREGAQSWVPGDHGQSQCWQPLLPFLGPDPVPSLGGSPPTPEAQ